MDESGEAEVVILGDELTLSDVTAGKPIPLDGFDLCLRWPSPEEYDDALAMQRLVRKREMRKPEVAELKDESASDETLALFRGLIAAAERSFREAETDNEKDHWNGQIAAWERALARSNLAEEIADERASLARDRWFAMHLLCHKDGKPYFNFQAKDFPDRWRKLPVRVKDAARPVIWRMMRAIDEAPFELETPPE